MNEKKSRNAGVLEQQKALGKIAVLVTKSNLAKAKVRLVALLKQSPDYADAHLLMGKVEVLQNHGDAAIYHVATASRLAPNLETDLYYATLLLASDQLGLAEKTLLELGRSYPEDTKNLRLLVQLYARNDDHPEELATLLKLKTQGILNNSEKIRLCWLLGQVTTKCFSHELVVHFCDLLDYDCVEFVSLSKPICDYLIQKYHLDSAKPQISMDVVTQDHLLIKALPKMIFASPEVEVLLTVTRKSILLTTLQEQRLVPSFVNLASAVCLQNYLNEYVHCSHQDEQEMVGLALALLDQQLTNSDWEPASSEALLLMICMYHQLLDLPIKPLLLNHPLAAWPESLQSIATLALFNPVNELEAMQHIPALTQIDDEVSKEVQQQYEQNPYPRWQTVNRWPAVESLDTLISTAVPGFNGPKALKEPNASLLIAGCGTGRQAVITAYAAPGARVTAVDISRRSLAYAQSKAEALGIDTIDFYQADILELPKTRMHFPYIECGGVLHHMQDPMKGWKGLVDMLEPGGVMVIALYSERARQQVTRERQKIAALNLQPTRQNIINYRQTLIHSQKQLSLLRQFRDFYSLSECRDLLFHQHEKCYSWKEIGRCCDTLGLDILGLYGKTVISAAYRKQFPKDKRMNNIEHLEQLEQAYPNMFKGMYSFICQKPF